MHAAPGYYTVSFHSIDMAFMPFDRTSNKLQVITFSILSLQCFMYLGKLTKRFEPFLLRDPSHLT